MNATALGHPDVNPNAHPNTTAAGNEPMDLN